MILNSKIRTKRNLLSIDQIICSCSVSCCSLYATVYGGICLQKGFEDTPPSLFIVASLVPILCWFKKGSNLAWRPLDLSCLVSVPNSKPSSIQNTTVPGYFENIDWILGSMYSSFLKFIFHLFLHISANVRCVWTPNQPNNCNPCLLNILLHWNLQSKGVSFLCLLMSL